MADITDQVAIKFSNEEVRPIAEEVVGLYYRILAIRQKWGSGYSVLFPNDTSKVIDNRQEIEGVQQLTGADINSLMSMLDYINATILGFSLNVAIKPIVRAISDIV